MYLDFAEFVLASLSSSAYFGGSGEIRNFVIKHCVGNLNKNNEVDVPLIYADYYYTEALLRYIEYYGEKE